MSSRNKSKTATGDKITCSTSQREFVERVASLLAPWGMPLAHGRIYGLLLLQASPVSLDDIVSALEMSKSSASVSARALVTHRLATRQSVPGSKRVLYSATGRLDGVFRAHAALMAEIAEQFQNPAVTGLAKQPKNRLKEMAAFLGEVESAVVSVLDD